MNKTNITRRLIRGLAGIVAGLLFVTELPAQSPVPPPLPYRFLLVINDQWTDASSEVIEGVSEFSMLCALLKSWGLPFDVFRLDQQRFDAYHLLDRSGQPLHGTILWNAPGARMEEEASALLRSLVKDHGVSMVAFSDTVATPVVAELAGVSHVGGYQSADALAFAGEHFITRGVPAQPEEPPVIISKLFKSARLLPKATNLIGGTEVKAGEATVIARRGERTFLTARQLPNGGRVAWLDADRATAQIYKQSVRDLLKRSLVWAQGYALYAEYPRSVMLYMDDLGTADKTFLVDWHYQTPTEDKIRAGLIEPLKRHRAVLVQNVNTGFVDRKTRRVLNPWRQQRVVDELDPSILHDFASTKRGLDAGVKAGVFEIQSHGWTHMLPDLDSPPGPWWTLPVNGEVIRQSWYKEFGDPIRKLEVPATTQRLHMQRSLDDLWQDFGVRPVSLLCGGNYYSRSPANNTMRIAAQMGFGLGEFEGACYVGRDLCFLLEPVSPRLEWNYAARLFAAEIPWTIDAPAWIGSHDRDVSVDVHSYARLLDDLGPGLRYMTYGEYCAYLHARVERDPAAGNALALRVRYDGQYCGFFEKHSSTWVLHLSDETRRALKSSALERTVINVPAGLGSHTVGPANQ